jgi:large repetitive protein
MAHSSVADAQADSCGSHALGKRTVSRRLISRVLAGVWTLCLLFCATFPRAADADPAPPAVSSVSPIRGASAGGNDVSIVGSGFTGTTAVKFGATTPAPSFTVIDDSHIHAISPPHAAGLVNIFVTTPSGTSQSRQASWFEFRNAPTVSKVSPIHGPASGFNAVIITGTGFRYATKVRFGQSNFASFAVNSDTQITAFPQANVPALVNIYVETPGGTNVNKPSSWYRFDA